MSANSNGLSVYRLDNYRSRIKSTQYHKLLPVEKHFKEQNHVCERDAKVMIIENLESVDTRGTRQQLSEAHEDNWIKQLQTRSPKGMNNELNHADKY